MTAHAVERTLDALFHNGDVRLIESNSGWEGFRREESAGEAVYYYVDTRAHVPPVCQEIRVGERAVLETLRERLKDEPKLAVADGGDRR